KGPAVTGEVKQWGRWATFGLGLIAQAVALAALTWWYGLDLAGLLDLAADGGAVILIVCISTPIRGLLVALMSRRTGASGPWLWLTVVVVAPIGEETLFRGFPFRGWHRAPRDAWLVIIVTALLWAFVHLQYDLYFIAQAGRERHSLADQYVNI